MGRTSLRRAAHGVAPPLILAYVWYVNSDSYAYIVVMHHTLLDMRTGIWAILLYLRLIVAHGVFAATAAVYLALLYGRTADKVNKDTGKLPSGIPGFLSRLIRPVSFAAPQSVPLEDFNNTFHECTEHGAPLRCWRDRCNGHYIVPRMRHCGTCGVCRYMLDHHCIWVRIF